MKLTTIGGGYVGLTASVCFASTGTAIVTCLDTNQALVKKLQTGLCHIQEPKLDGLLRACLTEKTLRFTSQAQQAIQDSTMILIAVGTPEAADGSPDLSQLKQATETIGKYLTKDATIIIKSTIPPGGTELVFSWIKSACQRSDLRIDVVYSPEFLREGSAIEDFFRPNRIIIGSDNLSTALSVAALYRHCQTEACPILYTTPLNAELIKYASNSFLALKVAFVDELARLCGEIGGNIDIVAQGMGMDSRIGSEFLRAGPGYGGACLPKDIRGFTSFARTIGAPLTVLEQADKSNIAHQKWIASVVTEKVPPHSIIAVWGLTFKANTADLRNSPTVSLIKILSVLNNYCFHLYDPTVHTSNLDMLEGVDHICFAQPEDALKNADALLIMVPWPEFQKITISQITTLMREKRIFDLCATYKDGEVDCAELYYWKLGTGRNGRNI